MKSTRERIAHACDLTVYTCIDFRLHGEEGIDPHLMERLSPLSSKPLKYDLITEPGACHCFAHPDDIVKPDDVIRKLGFTLSAHQTERVVLIQHEDCACYSKMRFDSVHAQLKVLAKDLETAAVTISRAFPSVGILGYIARVDGRSVRQFHEIELDHILHLPDQSVRDTDPAPNSYADDEAHLFT